MNYRTLTINDKKYINDIYKLIIDAFDKYIARDYNYQGIDTFKSFVTIENLNNIFDNKELIIGAFDSEKRIRGIIIGRGFKHLSLLFVDNNHHKKGIATNLLNTYIQTVKEMDEINSISVNSSPYARDFYTNRGFKEVGEIEVRDGIISIPMRFNIE